MKQTQRKFFLGTVNETEVETSGTADLVLIGPPIRGQNSDVEEESY